MKNYRFPLIILGAVLLGSVIGLIFGEDAAILKPLGDIFLNLLYTIVVPLVFLTITSSVANMTNLKRLGKILKYTFLIFIATSLVASLIMLIVLLIFDPVGGTKIVVDATEEVTKYNIGEQIVAALTVNDFSELLSRSHMLPLIIFSVLIGACLSMLGEQSKSIRNGLNVLSRTMMKAINLIMYYAPIGLCAYFASLIGEFGPELLGSYFRSMVIYYLLCIFYFFTFYSIYSKLAGYKPKNFFKFALNPTITALGTQSSLASLPTNLDASKNMNVPKDIREITLPIGATMHMEGSSMGAILKIVFLFAIFGQTMGPSDYIFALIISVLCGVVMSGIPGGGLIGEMLIVNLYGFPAEAVVIIATIGFLIDPPATALNVVGDNASALMVTKCVDNKRFNY